MGQFFIIIAVEIQFSAEVLSLGENNSAGCEQQPHTIKVTDEGLFEVGIDSGDTLPGHMMDLGLFVLNFSSDAINRLFLGFFAVLAKLNPFLSNTKLR